jgi:hypothetical protein
MVFTLVLSCTLAITAALVGVVLVKAVRRRTPTADPPVPTLTVAAGPGWYAETDGSTRYWDGSHWTRITRAAPSERSADDAA